MIELTKDSKHFAKLWSTWLYFLLMAVTALEGLSQVVAIALPHWEGLMTQKEYMVFVALTSTVQTVSRFIKQSKLSEAVDERKPD